MIEMNKVCVIIVAAGEGKRFGSAKPFALLRGKTVLERCLETFDRHPGISEIVLVLRDDAPGGQLVGKYPKLQAIAKGGKRRQDSVFSGFREIDSGSADIVLVHDAARPLVRADLIDRIIRAAKVHGAAVPVVPVIDTIKKVEKDRVSHTIDRQGLYRVQTPQGFVYDTLRSALEGVLNDPASYTDEASLVEERGGDVFVVPGDSTNIKITEPGDIKIAEVLLED